MNGTDLHLEDSQRWVRCFREFAKAVLTDADPDEALEVFLELACSGGQADGALVFLSSLGGQWLCEATHGALPQAVGASPLGMLFSLDPAPMGHLRAGTGLIGSPGTFRDSWVRDLGLDGPLEFVPIIGARGLEGVLVMWRNAGRADFERSGLPPAEAFAMQAALALDLISSRQARSFAAQVEERERISRDLHDLAIQGLFATGMRLRRVQDMIADGSQRTRLDREVSVALEELDESVAQIRSIVYRLRQEDASTGLVDLLRREASSARAQLGFAPTLVVEVDEDSITLPRSASERGPESLLEKELAEKADRAAQTVAEDVVAVVRESLSNVARHAKASSVSVTVSVHGSGPAGEIVLAILDDGSGVDPTTTRESGLANMERRATLRGGSFALGAGPRGRGTSLIWRAPLG